MRPFLTLVRREFSSHFLSPVAYVVIAVFLGVAGLNFWRLAADQAERPLGLSAMLFGSVFFWIMVLVVITAITMRLFAEERRSGTLEVLLTAPVRDVDIVLAKYVGAMMFFLTASAPSVSLFLVLRFLAQGLETIDWGPIAGGYLILALCGSFYIAVGLLVSSLTRSQVVAAVLCFSVLSLLFFFEFFQYVLRGAFWHEMIAAFAATQHVLDFAHGLVDTRAIVLYVSGTAFALFGAVKVVEAQRWR